MNEPLFFTDNFFIPSPELIRAVVNPELGKVAIPDQMRCERQTIYNQPAILESWGRANYTLTQRIRILALMFTYK